MPIRVAIIEKDKRLRESLAVVVNGTRDLCCEQVFATAEEALAALPAHWPAVLLIGARLSGLSGIDCTARLKTMHPDLRILLLVEAAEDDLIIHGFRAGAAGCLLREAYPAEVIAGILELNEGGCPLSREVARGVVHYLQQSAYHAEESPSYSKREHEILIRLTKGYQYKEIADSLSISIPTVRTHLRNIYKKLNVRSRTEAVVKFLSKRLY